MRMNLAFVLSTAHTIDQLAKLQPVKNGGDRSLAQADIISNGADRDFAKVPDRAHNQQLRPGEPCVLAQPLGMQIRCPDNPPKCYQHLLVIVQTHTPDYYLYL